jgi:hypothetical protein
VPALQRMLDFTDQSIEELEAALDLAAPKPPAKRPARKVSPKTA